MIYIKSISIILRPAFLLTGFILTLILSCHPTHEIKSQHCPVKTNAPNIIIISMNSLRSDHLGCYGYDKSTSPNIDKFARESILFRNAIAQSSHPLGSNASILTGLYPPSHGLTGLQVKLSNERTTLAEALNQSGYQTAAFTGGFHVSSIYGLDQGFETYFDNVEHGRLADVIPPALEWLKSSDRNNKKFFLFLQAYDCHTPHQAPKEYDHMFDPDYKGVMDKFILSNSLGNRISGLSLKTDQGEIIQLSPDDINHIIAHYDGALAYADKQLGIFLDKIKSMGLMDNSIIILMGDHGEAHMDHGYIIRRQHGGIYEEGVKVPLIIRLPENLKSQIARPASQIDTQAQLIDLMPTILDYIDIPAPHPCQGQSLKPLLSGQARPDFNEFIFSNGATNIPRPFDKLITIFPKPKSYLTEEWQVCIRSNEWKLLKFNNINGTFYELYHLEVDPREINNLAEKEMILANKLKERLNKWEKTTLNTIPLIEYNAALYNKIKEKWRVIDPRWLDDMDDGKDIFEKPNPSVPSNNK